MTLRRSSAYCAWLPNISLTMLLVGLFTVGMRAGPALASGTLPPSISLSSGTLQTGAAGIGAKITITGQRYAVHDMITLTLNGSTLVTTPTPLVTDTTGAFSAQFAVPSLNARTYPLIARGSLNGLSASQTFWVRGAHEQVLSPTSGKATFAINDTDPREPSMQYLRITNLGDANLVNPKVLTDGVPGQDPVIDMSSLQGIVTSLFAAYPTATTDAQKTFLLWDWLHKATYHWYDAQNPNIQDQPDIVSLLNNYGYMRCFNQTRLLADLFQTAGYQTRTWDINGHAVPEVSYGGAWHVYDTDQEKFFVGPDGVTVLGLQDLTANPHSIFLDTNPGGVATGYTAQYLANLYATTSDNKALGNVYPPAEHSLGITLRKNEALNQNWTNVGKYHDNYLHGGAPLSLTDGDIVYTPDLTLASYAAGVASKTNVAQDGQAPNLHAQTAGTSSSVIYRVTSPNTLVGGILNAQTYRATSSDALTISFSLDGSTWGSPIYTQSTLGYDNPQLDLSSLLTNGTLPEEYQYYLKFEWTAASSATGAGLSAFQLDSQFQQALYAIPPLHSGTTTVTYTDQSGTHPAGDVQIAYGWKANSTPADLAASTLAADYSAIPANGNTFATVTLTLKNSTGSAVAGMIVQLQPSRSDVQIERRYLSQSLRGQTDKNGQAVFLVRSATTGPVTLTTVDKNGTPLSVAPITVNFTTSAAQPLLTPSEGTSVVNGGFESGDLSGWTAGGKVTPTISTTSPYAGADSAQLGNSATGAATDSSLMETLTIPTTTKTLKLAYNLANTNNDTANYLEVWVRDTAGESLSKFYSGSARTSGWATLNLTLMNKYRGNTIQVFINLHRGSSTNRASVLLDAVQLG